MDATTKLLIFFTVYASGYILSLFILIKWGKKMGFDYSGEKTYANYEDYDSNAEAYTTISLFSWAFIIVMLLVGLWKLLKKITERFIRD